MTSSIKAFIFFGLDYYEEVTNWQQAVVREKYFKSSAGRSFLKDKSLE